MPFHIFRRRKAEPKAERVRYEGYVVDVPAIGTAHVWRTGGSLGLVNCMCHCYGPDAESHARLIADALNKQGR
jgi:hypothetical protein